MTFLDASVLLAAEDRDDKNHPAAIRLLESGSDLATLDLAAYETANVAIARWRDEDAAARLSERVFAIGRLGTLVRADAELISNAVAIAAEHGISAYDAAYVAGARSLNGQLVSCDERDLVSRDLALLP